MSTEDQDLHDGEETILLTGNDAPGTGEDRGDVVVAAPAATAPRPAAVTEPASDAEAETDASGQHIPKARFDAVYAQRKDFQRRAEEAEAELDRILASGARAAAPAAKPFDEAAAEAAYFEAMMDGDQQKAVQIRREINANLQHLARSDYQTMQSAQSAMEALDAVTTSALEAHPWLDTEAGEEALEAIVALRDRKIASGTAAHLALAQAVAAIAPRFAPEGAAPGEGSPGLAQVADTRSRRSLIRGAAAAENQPPAIQAGLGNRTTASRVDVQNLTEEQFDALTPAEKAKLRGD